MPTFTRLVDFSGAAGAIGSLDPILRPAASAVVSDIVRGGEISNPTITIAAGSAVAEHAALLRCVNGAALKAGISEYVQVTTTVNAQAGGSNSTGGIFLVDVTGGASDGDGYVLNYKNTSGTHQVKLFTLIGGTLTQVWDWLDTPVPTAGFLRLRLTAWLDGDTINSRVEASSTAAGEDFTTIRETLDMADAGGAAYGVALCSGTLSATFRDTRVTFAGPELIAAPIGQSETAGRAAGYQRQGDPNLKTLRRDGTIATLSDPWSGSGTNADYSGVGDDTGEGSWIVAAANRLATKHPTQLWVGMGVDGGQAIGNWAPAATAEDVTTPLGAVEKAVQLYAGDGRNGNQRVVFLIYTNTRDCVLLTAQGAGYEAYGLGYSATAANIAGRLRSLFPACELFIAKNGGREYADCDTEASAAIREGVGIAIRKAGLVELFDDAEFVGLPGNAGGGWPNQDPGDDLHPGAKDNERISTLVARKLGAFDAPSDPASLTDTIEQRVRAGERFEVVDGAYFPAGRQEV